MDDNAMIEQWNPIDSAKMAVSVESVLYRIIHDRKLPFDFDEALDTGIAFLEEAKNGGAIISGNPETGDFTGTLSPLRLTTTIYLRLRFSPSVQQGKEIELYKNIVNTLKDYRNLLEKVKKEKRIKDESERTIAGEVHQFFNALANTLITQTDPISATYSRQI